MREYIKQVKRALRVSRAQKREIIRDLTEAFASAREHGETEAQVLELSLIHISLAGAQAVRRFGNGGYRLRPAGPDAHTGNLH